MSENEITIQYVREQIAYWQKILARLNPYSQLPMMSNKEFGESWSENYIRSKVPNLTKDNGAGHDMRGKNYQHIEVKSSRIVFSGNWTENQIHPTQADAYIFVWYNCEEGTEEICFIPTDKMLSECKLNLQHGTGCFSMAATIKNRKVLQKYMVSSWEELNEKV